MVLFSGQEDYDASKDAFGNLVPLEERLNKRAQNAAPGEKAPVYSDSRLQSNRLLAEHILHSGFGRGDRTERTESIVAFFKAHWPIPSYDDSARQTVYHWPRNST